MTAHGKCSYATVKNAVLLEEMKRGWRAEGHGSSLFQQKAKEIHHHDNRAKGKVRMLRGTPYFLRQV